MKKLLPSLALVLLTGLTACKDDDGDSGASCVYDSETHAVGDEFPAIDGCNTCTCVAGEAGGASVSCTEEVCHGGCDGGLARCSAASIDASIDAALGGCDGGVGRCHSHDGGVDAGPDAP